MNDQSTPPLAILDWRSGDVPVSRQFDDPYFSLDDGLAETRHVFLAGSDLPGRFTGGFRIAELGFGTGLNFLATLAAFRAVAAPGWRLHYTAFEAFPMSGGDLARALASFGDLPVEVLIGGDEPRAPPPVTSGHDFDLTLVAGDANETLPGWTGRADAWYLDGFSPAKNPELWNAALLGEVGRHTVPDGTFATYTAAGHVRRALTEAGFDVARVPGYGRKRHMSRGVLTRRVP